MYSKRGGGGCIRKGEVGGVFDKGRLGVYSTRGGGGCIGKGEVGGGLCAVCFNTALRPELCTLEGKIPGDGRKFLEHFKSYLGSQTATQSLKLMRSISTDYSQNPQQKVSFFIHFCL